MVPMQILQQNAIKVGFAGEEYHGYEPKWFRKEQDPQTGNVIHAFTNEYWTCKEKQDWIRCPDIYL